MAVQMEEEKSPFLPTDNHDGEPWQERPQKRARTFRIHGLIVLVELLLLGLNIGFFFMTSLSKGTSMERPDFEEAFSPATSAVPYKVETIDVYEPSPFTGEPRHEVDVAWSDLLRSTQIRVSESEMLHMNKTSVTLLDGSGYLGYPEALHQLHCVKRMYQYRHQDYYTNLNTHTFGLPHWDHCIEVLRRGIMCNADLTINTVEWRDGEIKGVSTHPRVCRDWGMFEEWADARALKGKAEGMVVGEGEEDTYGPLDLL